MRVLAIGYLVAATVTALLPAVVKYLDENKCLRLAQAMALVGIALALLARP